MKFILNEKFILDERFILTEAEESILATAISKIKETIENKFNKENFKVLIDYYNGQAQGVTTDANAIKEAENGLDQQFKANQKDWTILQGAATQYCDVVKEAINKEPSGAGSTLNSLKNASKLITNLEDSASVTPADDTEKEAAIKDLKYNFERLSAALDTALQANGEKSTKDAQEALTKITEIQNNLMETYGKILDIQTSGDAEKAIAETFNNFNSTLLANTIPDKIEDEAAATATMTKLENVQAACEDLEKDIDLDNFIPDEKKEGRDDWATKHAKAVESRSAKIIGDFWDEYYTTVWGSKASKVRDLAPAFETELKELGFTDKTNKFITFVQNNLEKLNLSHNNYPAIHNAYVDKAIEDDTLINPSNNLLSNVTLLSMGNHTILDYLKAQNVLSKSLSSAVGGDHIYKDVRTALAAILTDGINVEKGEIPRELDVSKISKLRPISGIKNASKAVTGEKLDISDSSAKSEIKVEDVWKDAQKDRSKDQAIAYTKLALGYLTNKYQGTDGLDLTAYKKKYDLPDLSSSQNDFFRNYFRQYAQIKYPKKFIEDLIKVADIKEA